jgi:hypothetical protein
MPGPGKAAENAAGLNSNHDKSFDQERAKQCPSGSDLRMRWPWAMLIGKEVAFRLPIDMPSIATSPQWRLRGGCSGQSVFDGLSFATSAKGHAV